VPEPLNIKRVAPTDPADEADDARRRPFARIAASPVVRRLALGRLAWGLVAGAAVLGLLVLAGKRAMDSATAWLHSRPEHLLPFGSIALEPSPPAWILSGSSGLLEQVRTRSRLPEQLAVYDLDPGRLAEDFQRESPWVRSVRGIERAYPNRLTVRLEYRQPVAVLRPSGPTRAPIYLDRDGVVLPSDDLDPAGAGRLVLLKVAAPEGATVTPNEGRLIRIEPGPGPKTTGNVRPELAQEAARLAAFFRDHGALAVDPPPTVAVDAIHADAGGIWVQLADQKILRWGSPPGSEAKGEPDAGRKWTLLNEWVVRNRHAFAEIRYPRVLDFERDRVVIRN
jgi:hypothetical protein